MIRLDGIAKSFAAVPALADVSLTIPAGRVHGLLGENGAGKSTLMRILFGMIQPDAGVIGIDGEAVRIASPRDARRLGLGMVHQHFALVPTLDAVGNVALAVQSGFGRVDRLGWERRITALADGMGWSIDLRAPVGSLAVGQQQRVEIIKALISGSRALILDEPTAVLTPQEVDELIPALRRLAAGGTAIVFISHKLAEVERLCDDVAILRRGRVVHRGPIADLTRQRMAALMMGEAPEVPSPAPSVSDRRSAIGDSSIRLSVSGLTVSGAGRGPAVVDGATLAVHAGEVVGIAGVDGNGQGALVQAVLGLRAATGRVLIPDGNGIAAIGVIPEDRQRDGLVLPWSIAANLAIKHRRVAPWSRGGWRRPAAWRRRASDLMAAHDVRAPSPSAAVATLSGGNQQKVVVARELAGRPRLIIAVNPTRGLDVGASAAVMRRLAEARADGAGVLLVYGDLDELLAIADRVLVMHRGRVTDSGHPATTREAIGGMMLG